MGVVLQPNTEIYVYATTPPSHVTKLPAMVRTVYVMEFPLRGQTERLLWDAYLRGDVDVYFGPPSQPKPPTPFFGTHGVNEEIIAKYT